MDCSSPSSSRCVGHRAMQAPWLVLIVWALAMLGPVAFDARAGELASVVEKVPPRKADSRLHEQLAMHRDRPVLINFWATWCAPCREEMPSLQRLATRWKDKGLAVITVAVADNRERADGFLWEIDVTLPVIHDPAQGLSRPWRARVLPTTLILERRHRIRLRAQGAIDWDSPAIDQQLQTLFK